MLPASDSTAALAVTIGISDNPAANVFTSPPNQMTPAAQKALIENVRYNAGLSAQIGAKGKYISRRWDEMEPAKGRYDFGDVEGNIQRAADVGQTVELFTLRAPDTNNRSVPADLARIPFDQMTDRLLRLLDELAPRLGKAGSRRVCLGNEIDLYFKDHRGEVAPFSTLFAAVCGRLRQAIPGIKISTTVTFGGVAEASTRNLLAPILRQCDFLCMTYYPLDADFTMRPPSSAIADLTRMTEIAAQLRLNGIVLQEVGYPSSPLNGSSEDLQAQFYSNILNGLQTHGRAFQFANFFLMCDLPGWMADDFGRYYRLANSDRFKAYLQTLGLFDGQGKPKKAWKVLESGLKPRAADAK